MPARYNMFLAFWTFVAIDVLRIQCRNSSSDDDDGNETSKNNL